MFRTTHLPNAEKSRISQEHLYPGLRQPCWAVQAFWLGLTWATCFWKKQFFKIWKKTKHTYVSNAMVQKLSCPSWSWNQNGYDVFPPDLLVVISITSRTKQDQQVGTYAPWTLPSRTSETLPVFIVHTQARWWCLSRGLPNKHVCKKCKANSNTIPATSCCELWWTRPSQGAADINPIDIRTFDSIVFATQKKKVLRQRFNYACSCSTA